MARYETTIPSGRSAQDTFDYLADFSTTEEWDPGVVQAERLDDGPIGPGARFRVVSRFLGRDVPLEYTVTAFEPGYRVSLRGENGTTVSEDEITVESDARGTRVHYDADLQLKGPGRLLDPALKLVFKHVGDRAADGLRQALAA